MIQNRNATAAYSRTLRLRDQRTRYGEKILVVEDSLPAGRNDRPGAGRSGRQAGARMSAGPGTRDRRRGFVFRSAPGDQRPARDRILNCRRDRTGFLRR